MNNQLVNYNHNRRIQINQTKHSTCKVKNEIYVDIQISANYMKVNGNVNDLLRILTFDRNRTARSVWISSEGLFAAADWHMIGDSTISVNATSSRTGIDATVVYATLVPRTVAAQNTFWSTRAIRITDIIGRADTINSAVLFPALSVGAARIGIARSRRLSNIRFN